ncbi:MAG: Cbb3-type cytochrome c oxidase subunit CcoP [Pseudomonadota bacterium]
MERSARRRFQGMTAAALFAGAMLASGCEATAGASAARSSRAVASAPATSPASVRAAGSALATVATAPGSTDAVGAALYLRKCGPCHGPGGRGDGPEAQFFARAPRDLRSGFLEKHADDELVAKIRDGQSLRVDIDAQAMRTRARETEAIAQWMRRLPGIDWDNVDRGNEVYLDRCEACHGPFGRVSPTATLPPGVTRLPRDLSSPDLQASMSDRQLALLVRHGRKGMPAIPGLDDSDTGVLVAYVRTLSPGHELFGVYCASCHGEDGRGSAVAAAEGDRPPVVFDRAYMKRNDPEELRGKIWHMLAKNGSAMPHFSGRLTDAEARQVVAYLRATEIPPAAPGASPGPAHE